MNRSLLTLAHTRGMQMLIGIFSHINRSLVTTTHTFGLHAARADVQGDGEWKKAKHSVLQALQGLLNDTKHPQYLQCLIQSLLP